MPSLDTIMLTQQQQFGEIISEDKNKQMDDCLLLSHDSYNFTNLTRVIGVRIVSRLDLLYMFDSIFNLICRRWRKWKLTMCNKRREW